MNPASLIAINVGNTRTHLGRIADGEVSESRHVPTTDAPGATQIVVTWWNQLKDTDHASIIMASVHDEAANRLASMIKDQLSVDVYRIGRDLPVAVGYQLDPETITGVDRLLNASAAYDILKQACVVIDAGTAVTVDFVDGEGVFHGGAIAPGGSMQLQSMHNHTTALPDLDFARPDSEAFGRSTSQAMMRGVYYGIQGLVRRLVETYSEAYGAYPQVIATGGDAQLLFENDELIDRIVPDLTLLGIAVTARYALATGDDVDAAS